MLNHCSGKEFIGRKPASQLRTGKEAGELLFAQHKLLHIPICSPWEGSAFKAFLIKPETVTVPFNDLH